MKFSDLLTDEQKKQLNQLRKRSPRKKKLFKSRGQKYTREELEELMGVHRDIYERRNGAIRRK